MYLVNLVSIFLFLIVCVYFDLTYRRIPNKFLKIYLLITFVFITLEGYIYLDTIIWYIFIKSLIFSFIFLLTLTLFVFRLLGGGDGKVLILLFHSLPFIYIFHFLKYFFLVFGCFLLLFLIINYFLKNKMKNCENSEIVYKMMHNVIFDDCSHNFKNKQLRTLRKKHILPIVLPIFFSYITVTIWLFFII
ncbi:MAG: prepilin peptidase [Promethearchaeota archaeon]